MKPDYHAILHFWFEDLTPEQWFAKDPKLDRRIADKFSTVHQKATHCELFPWRQHPRGRLAEIILLDQFSRNLFRDSARSFAYDPLSLALAQEAIACAADLELNPNEKSFLYMPYMHSESSEIHDIAVTLFDQPGLEYNLSFEIEHKAIIDRFGRYPHRNALLGRTSTEEEVEFLKQPGSGF